MPADDDGSNLQTIVVMANGLCTDLKIKHTFDLKGEKIPVHVPVGMISDLAQSVHNPEIRCSRVHVHTGSSYNRYVKPAEGEDQVLKVHSGGQGKHGVG